MTSTSEHGAQSGSDATPAAPEEARDRPLTEAELQSYVAFWESPAGQVLNAALFSAFDTVFRDVSLDLGRAAGRALRGEPAAAAGERTVAGRTVEEDTVEEQGERRCAC